MNIVTEVDTSRGGLEETLIVQEPWLFPSTQDREFLSLGVVH